MRVHAPLLILALTTALSAQTVVYNVALSGTQENPPVPTAGSGTATVTLDTATRMVTVAGTFTNLNGLANAAHIHGVTAGSAGRRGRNVGLFVTLSVPSATSGTISGSGTLTATQMQVLMDGLTYLNVHSGSHPGGEIRGQIDTVPTSGSPGAAPVTINGPATGGGALTITCPAGTGPAVIMLGAALAPLGILPLPAPPACTPGPVNLGVNLAIPPIIVSAPTLSVTIPASITSAELGIQCIHVNPAGCVDLSEAIRLAIRP